MWSINSSSKLFLKRNSNRHAIKKNPNKDYMILFQVCILFVFVLNYYFFFQI